MHGRSEHKIIFQLTNYVHPVASIGVAKLYRHLITQLLLKTSRHSHVLPLPPYSSQRSPAQRSRDTRWRPARRLPGHGRPPTTRYRQPSSRLVRETKLTYALLPSSLAMTSHTDTRHRSTCSVDNTQGKQRKKHDNDRM